MNRYEDGNNLYYIGVRVDGSAIIKKKKNGTYYTLTQIPNIYQGSYNRDNNPNLLPQNKWIGLRSEIKNITNNKVEIKLYIDKLWQGNWQLIASTIDDGVSFGGSALVNSGLNGIRTDFMDVEFRDFKVIKL